MTDRATKHIARAQALEGKRGLWMQHWDDLARVELPRRLGFVTKRPEGSQNLDNIFDGTAMQSARGLANDIGGLVRPEGEPWFFIKAGEDADENTDEAKEWLADSEGRMRRAFDSPKARFRQATGEADLDLVVFGTAIMFIGEGKNDLLFQSVHLKDGLPFYGETGNLEGMYRKRMFTIRQAFNRWGDKLSGAAQEKFKQDKFEDNIEILFAVVPRKEGRANAIIAVNMPVAEIIIEVETKHEIKVGGFNEFPYIVPRWDTSSGEDYGRSPGMIALPDANTSQAIGETMLIAGQRAADPPLLTPSDAFINAPNTFPGGLASYESEAIRELGPNAIRPLEGGRNFPLTFDMQNSSRDQIRSGFLRDRFNLPQPGEAVMTATEVIARQREFIREMGPVFGRFETDYTAPMVERAFNIMLRAGAFAEIPPALQGRSIRFEYESAVKRIRQQAEAAAAREWKEDLIATATTTGREDVMDVINFDEYGRFTAEAGVIPKELVNGQESIAAVRQQRAEVQAQERAIAEAQAGAQIAKTGGEAVKTLSGA